MICAIQWPWKVFRGRADFNITVSLWFDGKGQVRRIHRGLIAWPSRCSVTYVISGFWRVSRDCAGFCIGVLLSIDRKPFGRISWGTVACPSRRTSRGGRGCWNIVEHFASRCVAGDLQVADDEEQREESSHLDYRSCNYRWRKENMAWIWGSLLSFGLSYTMKADAASTIFQTDAVDSEVPKLRRLVFFQCSGSSPWFSCELWYQSV